jgi:lysozyme
MSNPAPPAVTRHVTDILSQLKADEGYSRFPKPDSHGTLEFGYGFNIQLGGIFEDESDAVLGLRVRRIDAELAARLPWTQKLDRVRFGVLENMAYEMGVVGLVAFHEMLTAMPAGNWRYAANAMRQSKWYTEVPARAERLAKQMETGEWQ